jgi:hypothetical protein
MRLACFLLPVVCRSAAYYPNWTEKQWAEASDYAGRVTVVRLVVAWSSMEPAGNSRTLVGRAITQLAEAEIPCWHPNRSAPAWLTQSYPELAIESGRRVNMAALCCASTHQLITPQADRRAMAHALAKTHVGWQIDNVAALVIARPARRSSFVFCKSAMVTWKLSIGAGPPRIGARRTSTGSKCLFRGADITRA